MTTASKIFHRYSRAKTAIIAASTLSLSSSSVLAHQHLASSVSGFNHHNIHTSSLSSTYHSFKKHTLSIQGYGEFIFNCNGSVKVVFEDRTLVELDAITTSINPIAPPLPLECACITDKYGNLIKVRLAKPIGFEWVKTKTDWDFTSILIPHS